MGATSVEAINQLKVSQLQAAPVEEPQSLMPSDTYSDESSDPKGGSMVRNKPRQREFQRRKRLTREQLRLLLIEFERDSSWTKKQVAHFAARMGLERVKVYKWGWDRKKNHRLDK